MTRNPFVYSRREFIAAAAGTGAAMLPGLRQLRAEETDPRVAQIVARTIAVDMHSHVRPQYVVSPAVAKPDPDIDLAADIRQSGFSAVCQTYDADTVGKQGPGVYYKFNLDSLDFEDRLLKRNKMQRALVLSDLEAAPARNQPIIVQSTEGAQFIEGKLERIEEVYKRGMRHLQIVHEQDDPVAPLGDVYTAVAHLGGLTQFGEEVVRECNRLGMVVDMAHATADTVRGALKASSQPILISHTGMVRETDNADMKRRLIARDVAREVADAGGVIGVWWRLSERVSEYVGGIKAMVDAVGVDHTGIGTDSDITSSNILPYTNKIWPDQNAGFFYAVAGEMLKQGFTAEEIGKIGAGIFAVYSERLRGRGRKVRSPGVLMLELHAHQDA